MAGGVTGVSAGNRTSYDPSTPGRSSISMGRGSAHGSMSSDSGSVSVGLILTLRIPSSGRGDAMFTDTRIHLQQRTTTSCLVSSK